jgi:hypothetical protein
LVCGREGSIPFGKGGIGWHGLRFETGRPKAPKPKDGERHVAQPGRAIREGCWQTFGGVFFCTFSESTFAFGWTSLANRWSQCLYVITGAQCFHPDFEKLDIEPEPVILFKLLSAFGPLPDALVKHVNHEEAGALLKGLWQGIAEDESNERFEQWSEEMFPNLDNEAKRLILRMTNLDPAKRALMSDIVMDPYWKWAEFPRY